jgi:hypothetical protein
MAQKPRIKVEHNPGRPALPWMVTEDGHSIGNFVTEDGAKDFAAGWREPAAKQTDQQ